MCDLFGNNGASAAAEKAASDANARADEALAAAEAANAGIAAALVTTKDSEAARKASEDRQRKLIGSGGGLAAMPITNAPIGTQVLFGT